jgi:hypothetical protein
MSELYDRIISQRGKGKLEDLMNKIPGFTGYMDNKARRTADRLVRDHVASEVKRRITQFVDVEERLLNDGGLRYMSETSSVKSRMQLFHDRLKAVAPGYSGFFAEIEITADDMDKLYAFDEAIIRYVDELDSALIKLASAAETKEGVETALAEVDRVAGEANDAFSLRDNVIIDLGK